MKYLNVKTISSALFFLLLILVSVTYMIRVNYRFKIFAQEGDFAAYANSIYGAATGNFFKSTTCASVYYWWPTYGAKSTDEEPKVPDNFNCLGIHFIPAIYLTNVVFYKLIPTPQTILFSQILAFTLASVLLWYLFGLYQLSSPLKEILAFGFLVNPGTVGAILNAFHPVVMASPFLILALIFIKQNRWYSYLFIAALLCFIQENVGLSVMAMSFVFLLQKDYKKFAISLGFSTFLTVLVIKYLIPHFNPQGILPYGHAYGSKLGDSMGSIIIGGLNNPVLLFQVIFTPEKINWMLNLLLPLGFLSLLNPIHLFLAAIGVGPTLVSENKSMLLTWGQYNALAIPFLYAAAGIAIMRIKNLKILNYSQNNLTQLFLISIIVVGHLWTYSRVVDQVPELSLDSFKASLTISPDKHPNHELMDLVSLIPLNSSVSASEHVLGFLFNRDEAYFYPVKRLEVDYVLTYKNYGFISKEKADFYFDELLKNNYQVVKENSLAILFKKAK